ncbi:MAG: class I SAM-dependent methyltransferase [bacterium]
MNSYDKNVIIKRYTDRFKKFGIDIKTLASGDTSRQKIRYDVFLRIGELNGASLLDVGCGLGDFYQYLLDKGIKLEYTGIDICPAFIDVCKQRFPNGTFLVADIQTDTLGKHYDYIISSQTYNNKLEKEDNMTVVHDVLKKCYSVCKKALAFDFITSYVDYKEERLYYYSPEKIFTFCKQITKRVALLHDYPLYEFAIFLYKDFKGWRADG